MICSCERRHLGIGRRNRQPAASKAAGLYQTSDLTLIEYGRPNVWPSTYGDVAETVRLVGGDRVDVDSEILEREERLRLALQNARLRVDRDVGRVTRRRTRDDGGLEVVLPS